MSDLARRLAGNAPQEEGILARLLRGFGRAAQSGVDDMNAALTGYRVKPSAVLTDAGYVMPEDLARGNYDSATEREPDTLRALTLFGGAMTPARGAGIAAKAGAEAKAAASATHALPMDEASRMQRAREMGYTVDAYHGTKSDIDAFRPGSFFGERPEIANQYAQIASGDVGANVIPVKIRPGNVYEYVTYADDTPYSQMVDQSVDAVRARGFDTMRMPNGVHVVLNPENVRSRFAAFDPAGTGAADVLASSANMGPLVNSLMGRRDLR